MLKKAVPNLKRWVSGYLVAVMTLMLVFNNSFAFSALAAETASGSNAEKEASASDAFKDSKVSLKNGTKEDVQFLIFSEQASYEPGETVCLDLYIKNNTDKVITDGLLKLGKAKGIEKDSVYFEDMTDVYEAMHRDDEKPEETEEGTSEEEAENKEDAATESKEEADTENSESAETESSLNVDEEVKDTAAEAAETLIPTEDVAKTANDEVLGTDVAETEAETVNVEDKESTVTIEETEEKVEEGSVAVEDSEETTIDNKKTITEIEEEDIDEGKTEETDEEDKEEEEDPERLSELEILPGKTAYINFYYTIDPEIKGMKDQKVDFSFNYVLEDEDGKQDKNTLRESFRYAVDALNLMTVTAGGEKGFVETGKEDEMLLEFDLGQMREMLEEAVEEEIDKMENADASAAEAKRASASDLLIKWDDESSDGAGSKKDPAVIKNLKCEVETFGLKLEKFKAVPVKDNDNFGTSLKCNFYVSRKTLPGTYYGRVNASYKIKGKSFHTVQGFQVVVKQETGELELVGKIGDSEIVMTGPVSSFPKADELSLKVSEVTQEQQEKVDEALQKKAEEEGNEIKQYKALDIKLIADGEETEPEGDVQVRFKNVELENADEKKEAEQEKAEEQSIVKKAVRKVMSLFGAKDGEEDVAAVAEVNEAEETTAEGSKKAAGTDGDKKEDEGKEESAGSEGAAENSENIKVLHLDEDAVVANEMKSEVKENGDVVMDTDHFSIYIVVNVPDVASVTVEVHHYANIERWELEDTNKRKVEMSWDLTSKEWKYYYVDASGNKTQEISSDTKLRLTEVTTKSERESLLPLETVTMGNNGQYTFTDHVLYPGAANPKDSNNRYRKIEKAEIYSSDTYEVPNGAGTGITYTLAVDKWSKVSSAGRYNVQKIVVTNKGVSEDEEDEELKELRTGKTIENVKVDGKDPEVKLAAGKNVIDIYYEPTKGDKMGPVYFHDYNVGIEEDSSGKVKTNRVGINNVFLKDGENDTKEQADKRIGIGINNGTGTDKINNYLPHHVTKDDLIFSYNNDGKPGTLNNTAKRYGIPAEIIQNGQFKVNTEKISVDPGLFIPNSIPTKEIYRGGATPVDYYAKEYIDDLQLKFSRNGDNYILTAICDKNNNEKLGDLDRLVYSGDNWGTTNPMFTNLFWPLDDDTLFKGTPGKTRDHKYGDKKHGIDSQNDEVPLVREKMKDQLGEKDANNIEIPHNWFFGMNCQLKFKVGDYIGPMNYYFRGDDDFWLYVDGVLVKDVDLGGTHKAVPAYVDLRKWMKSDEAVNGGVSQDPNTEHTMSIFFMERGGTGSCCYMAFTLPNAEIVPITNPKADFVDVTVTKNWLDDENAFFSRPGSLQVELFQEGKDKDGNTITKKFAETTLYESNGWTHTWTGFPKYCLVNSEKEEFKYYAREVTNEKPERYEVDYYNPTDVRTEITNVLKIDIPVEKKWEGDELENRPEQIEVQLWKKYEDIPQNSNKSESIISQNLNEEDKEEDSNDENIMDEEGEVSNDNPIESDYSEENGMPNEDNLENQNQENDSIEEEFIFPIENDENWHLVDTQVLKNTDDWKYTWNDKPLYEKIDGAWKKVFYTIKELDDACLKPGWKPDGWYKPVYEGNATDGFTIINTFIDSFSGEIPISKECIDIDGEATFKFNIEEVQPTENGWEVISGTSFPEASITVKDSTVTNGEVAIEYRISDVSALEFPVERWYKITEKDEEGNFIYDKTSYIIKMVLRKNDDGTYIAQFDPSTIYKNEIPVTLEDWDGKEIRLPFVNYKKAVIQITKNVVGSNSGEKAFQFIAKITKDAFSDTIKFSVKAGSTTSISVPAGSTVEIQEEEESHKGYHVSYDVSGTTSETVSEDTIRIIIPNDAIPIVNVTCTNQAGAVLPDTGGPGLLMMSRLGWMLLLLALLMAGMEIQFYGERRNRKAATVQREDSRGFAPDDY